MKKVCLIGIAAAILLGFSACSSDKKAPATEATAPTEEVIVEEVVIAEEAPAEEAPAKSADQLLKEFDEFVRAYADASNNKTKNIKKYTELAQQSVQWSKDIQAASANFTAKQKKKADKLLQDLIKINSPQ